MTLVPRVRLLSAVLSLVAFVSLVSFNSSVFAQTAGYKLNPNEHVYTLVQAPDGSTTCRIATAQERKEMLDQKAQPLHLINHLKDTPKGPSAEINGSNPGGLNIYLLATDQLHNSYPAAEAAFIKAAEKWEAIIKSPITIYIMVDFGPQNFGVPWSSGVIGSTKSFTISASYPTVRNTLIVSASNGSESSLYSMLPQSSVPTDAGNSGTMVINTSIARALGFLPANADPNSTNGRPQIGFNSARPYDFNPDDGVSGGTDFVAVAAHEIGHALGFVSANGEGGTPPRLALWDLFRFRPGVNDFTSTQRIMTIGGGLQIFYAGGAELGLSTGGPDPEDTDGDGQQSSHWRDDNNNTLTYIGIMDPTISPGRREDITVNDINALNFMGYNMEGSVPPPPPPPPPPAPANNNFSSAQVITGCSGSVTGTNISATKETGEPSHSPDNNPGGASVWYQWQAPSTGSVTITTAGSNFDTLLAVYTGNSVNGLSLLQRNDDASVTPHVVSSSVTFNATAGVTYRIAVDGYDNNSGGDTGNIVLNWNASNCVATTPVTVQFNQSSYSVSEGGNGFINIVVTRTGTDISGPATVKYATSDSTDANFKCDQVTGVASRKCDYHIATGKLRFAAGEQTKQFTLSIINDVYVEGSEALTLTLSNPTGATLGANSSVAVTITDNDVTAGAANPIDQTGFYVRQLYVDLLSREPDPAGWSGWTSRIDLCGQVGQAPPPCNRVTVGGDGFLRSGEFFDRQFFVLRLYRTGLGRILRYDEVSDLAMVSGFLTDTDLELNKQDLVAEFVARPEFANHYNPLSNAAFVATLLQTAGVTVPQSVIDEWVTRLNANPGMRAQVFREISERQEVSNKFAHEAQVVSAYYGFFSRNPDGAYLNYLQRLDSGEINLGDLANAFINAAEYRQRFGQ